MRRLDITDIWWPYGHVAVMLGGFFGALIALALATRWVDQPLINLLAPLVEGDWNRGFAVGLASGIAPSALGWWLLVGRRRRAEPEAPLGTLHDEEGFCDGSTPVPDEAVATRGGALTTLTVGVMLFVSLVPFLMLGPAWRNKYGNDESNSNPTPEERMVADRLPGAEAGAEIAGIAGALVVVWSWVASSSRRRRSGPEDGANP